MKLTCTKSGIALTVPEFAKSALPDGAHHYTHPIFSATPKVLIRCMDDFLAQRLAPQETILLFLAIADSTGHMVFRHPFQCPTSEDGVLDAAALFSAHMQGLASVATKVSALKGSDAEIPKFVCERPLQQNTAAELVRCVAVWQEALDAFAAGHLSATKARQVLRLEEHLARATKLLQTRPGTYANTIAEWACLVGAFPDNPVSTHKHSRIAKSEHFKEVIKSCILRDGKALATEIAQVLEFCEDNISVEEHTIHGLALFEALRQEYRVKFSTLGYSLSVPRASSVPLTRDEEAAKAREVALLQEIRSGAPTEQPTRKSFSSDFAFMRAMAAWRASQALAAAGISVGTTTEQAAPNTPNTNTNTEEL